MIQIKTPDGWSEFDGIRRTRRNDIISTSVLNGTPEHLVDVGGGFVELKTLEHKKISGDYVYDVLGVKKNHRYITNGVISHNCIFRGSVDSLLSGKILERIALKMPIEVIDDSLKIYFNPVKDEVDENNKVVEEGHIYAMLVDCSEGLGRDYHAITVVDVSIEPYEVVAVYRNNTLSPLVLPQLIQNIAMKYNNAFILMEAESTGQQVATDLYYDLEYENVLMTVVDKNKQVIGFSSMSRLGVKQSKSVKAIGCSTIKTMIEKDKIRLNDSDLVSEFGTFVPKGGSYAAAEGATDDLAMTMVLFGWLANQTFFTEMTHMKLKDNLVGEMSETDAEKIMPFGIIDNPNYSFDGEEFHDKQDVIDWFH